MDAKTKTKKGWRSKLSNSFLIFNTSKKNKRASSSACTDTRRLSALEDPLALEHGRTTGLLPTPSKTKTRDNKNAIMDLSDRTGVSSLSDSLSVRASTLTSKDNTNTKVDGEKKKR